MGGNGDGIQRCNAEKWKVVMTWKMPASHTSMSAEVSLNTKASQSFFLGILGGKSMKMIPRDFN